MPSHAYVPIGGDGNGALIALLFAFLLLFAVVSVARGVALAWRQHARPRMTPPPSRLVDGPASSPAALGVNWR